MPDTAGAASQEELFSGRLKGNGAAPERLLPAKYKGEKFTCTFTGVFETAETGMTLDGICRSGIFSQLMKARFVRNTDGYSGAFNEGRTGAGS